MSIGDLEQQNWSEVGSRPFQTSGPFRPAHSDRFLPVWTGHFKEYKTVQANRKPELDAGHYGVSKNIARI